MTDPTSRLFRLLGLFQSRSVWTGRELADRLETQPRTVRRDISRLRELGYRIDSLQGLGGGYRLAAGGSIPPLLLQEDEAAAMYACLRVGAADGADPIGEAALRALMKLGAILPGPARQRAEAVGDAIALLPPPVQHAVVDLTLLMELAQSISDRTVTRMTYRDAVGNETERDVEPTSLIHNSGRWYLVGFDRLRENWRLFRLDRIVSARVLTFTFTYREPPTNAEMLQGREFRSWPVEAVVRFECPGKKVLDLIPARYRELVAETENSCTVRVGAFEAWKLAMWLVRAARVLETSVMVVSGAEVASAMRSLGTDLLRAASSQQAQGDAIGQEPAP